MRALTCPGCRQAKLEVCTDPETGLELDTCPECQGLWFDPGELRRLFTSKNLKSQFFLDDSVQNLQAVGFTINTKARGCPRCRVAMRETLVGDVPVDVCPDCQGLWLDHGELKRLIKKFQQSGLRGDQSVIEQIRGGLRDDSAAGRAVGSLLSAVRHLFAKP